MSVAATLRRPGHYAVVRPAVDRQLAMDAFAALPSGHPMVALLELDVTTALEAIVAEQGKGSRISLFAFVVRAIAVSIAEHPDLNLVRHGRRLVRFEDVDVCVPVEVRTPEGRFPREVVLRRAQDLSPGEIYAHIEEARTRHERTGETSDEDRWARTAQRAFGWLPWIVRQAVMRFLIHNAFRVKAHAGTTLVTSVGKFAAIPGVAFTFSTGPRAAVFVVGGVVDKPWVHEGRITCRRILSLSVMVDHDLVDGAPVARFVSRLQQIVESGEGLV